MLHLPDIKDELKSCTLCPRECAVDRNREANGFCRAGRSVEVCSAHLHFGEEPPISGTKGSGTIFFNHCNLCCVYCQNYQFSQMEDGKNFEVGKLADSMVSLGRKNAHNINLVTPTHYAIQIAHAVVKAKEGGLEIPIVYNSSGYEKVETLKMLDGLVDIYLVDMRYGDNRSAVKYSSCDDYVDFNRRAVKEMHRQVGDLKLTRAGTALRGVIVRHLVLPHGVSGTEEVFKFVSNNLGRHTYISFMSQYYPAFKASGYPEISRRIDKREYDKALSSLYKYNLKNGWVQEYMGGYIDSDFAGTNIEPDV